MRFIVIALAALVAVTSAAPTIPRAARTPYYEPVTVAEHPSGTDAAIAQWQTLLTATLKQAAQPAHINFNQPYDGDKLNTKKTRSRPLQERSLPTADREATRTMQPEVFGTPSGPHVAAIECRGSACVA